jgi:hypothetical protein
MDWDLAARLYYTMISSSYSPGAKLLSLQIAPQRSAGRRRRFLRTIVVGRLFRLQPTETEFTARETLRVSENP